MTAYTQSFYDEHEPGSLSSAQVIVPILMQLVRPKSVIDIGCGIGVWLHVFRQSGVIDILGVDGEHVPRQMLRIAQESFVPCDIASGIEMNRTFDLALCLEVAEHLPENTADSFVRNLTRLAPVVAFSAAIPHQGGTEHVNEQWPEYWALLFKRHGYLYVDPVRRIVWRNSEVMWWYAQNLFLFVRDGEFDRYPDIKKSPEEINPLPFCVVHPLLFSKKAETLSALECQVKQSYALKKLLPSSARQFLATVKERLCRSPRIR